MNKTLKLELKRVRLRNSLCSYLARRLTHLRKSVNYLGVMDRWTSNKLSRPARFSNRRGVLCTKAPIRKLVDNAVKNGFLRWNKDGTLVQATAQRRLVNWGHADIIRYYQCVINGVLNYYSFIDNRARLSRILHGLRYSCALTLTLKLKLRRMSQVFQKFGKYLTDPLTSVGLKILCRPLNVVSVSRSASVDQLAPHSEALRPALRAGQHRS